MRLRINDTFLDFNGDFTIERKFKTFENISSQQGDFSYDLSLPITNRNKSILTLTTFNRPITNNQTCVAVDNSGREVYYGFLRIDSVTEEINCTFYAGNSNWINILNLPLRNSFNWVSFDVDTTSGNIETSWSASSGIIWPLTDRGAMSTRVSQAMFTEDFQPFIYVKDIVKTVCNQSGIKLTGDLINDPAYNQLITTNNGISGLQKRIDDRTVYAGKSVSQAINTTYAKITFTDVSSPYSNSPNGNWSTGTSVYTADADYRRIKVELNIVMTADAAVGFRIVVDGVTTIYEKYYSRTTRITETIELDDIIANGSTIEVQMREQSAFVLLADVDAGSSIKITPVKFYKVFTDSLLPDMDAASFLSQIFRMFNVVTSYDTHSNTIKTTKFNNIKTKPEIDISPYLNAITETNFTEFLSSFGKKSRLVYQEQSIEEVEKYNEANEIPYGGGVISIDDDALEETVDIVTVDFVAPYQRLIQSLGTSLPYLGMVEIVETDIEVTISSVTDVAGSARFNISGTNNITTGALVRVKNSTNVAYEGDYRVNANTPTYIDLQHATFEGNATLTLVELELVDIDSEDQICLINVDSQSVTNITGVDDIWFGGTTKTTFAFSYFYLPNLDLPINSMLYGLYFDPINSPDSYQIGLKQNYSSIENITNDPVMIIADFNLPLTVFESITDIVPLRLHTPEFNLLFYPNRITGYEDSSKPCEIELIKL
jgi:hypothetical protein